MSKYQMPLSWIICHPHQGLWNWALVKGLRIVMPLEPIFRIMNHAIIFMDTCILFLRVLAARISSLGFSYILQHARVPGNISILYLDLGTHREGLELLLVIDELLPPACKDFAAYGFEANRDSFEQVAKKFAGRNNVQILHKALVHNIPTNGMVRLYKDMGSGLGDSIYRHTSESEEVECQRLSDFLKENQLIKDNCIVLLRMNIEGAEYDVIQDLVENELDTRIDGYFGMWDDLSKIDIGRDAEFRAFLEMHQIRPITFNGRDLPWPLRRKCIGYHMHTQLMHGLRKHQQVP